jgi:hypothetical protein
MFSWMNNYCVVFASNATNNFDLLDIRQAELQLIIILSGLL